MLTLEITAHYNHVLHFSSQVSYLFTIYICNFLQFTNHWIWFSSLNG